MFVKMERKNSGAICLVLVLVALAITLGCPTTLLARSKLPRPITYADQYFATDRIQKALRVYEKLQDEGGWPKVGFVKKLEAGQTHIVVPQVRARLMVTGDLKKNRTPTPEIYDEELVAAVKKFQGRHGLNEDGVIGQETLFELNVSVADRIRQLKMALKRIQEQQTEGMFTGKAVVVNLPAFHLDVLQDGVVVLSMRTIIGQSPARFRTPILNSAINMVVFHPTWNVPQSIAIREMLPKLKADPDYLKRNNYRVLSHGEDGHQDVDPVAIDWSQVGAKGFSYSFHQRPGGGNALGNIKFVFPNTHSVYLHDTNSRSLFARNRRDLSHGCVRVEKPLELAVVLFSGDPDWTDERIQKQMQIASERAVAVKTQVPVHFIYHTAWVLPDGEVHFRRDIYGYDD